jgi:hypothetical protein
VQPAVLLSALTVTDAVDLAAEGKLADGYAVLFAGHKRAE